MQSGSTLDASGPDEVSGSRAASSRLRAEMAVCADYAYFDHAAVAPLPKSAANALTEYAAEAAQHGDAKWLEWAAGVEQCRSRAANLLEARVPEVALVGNTTQGIHIVASGLDWQPGDNVVVPGNEFPSNLLPWRALQQLGVEVREVRLPSNEELSVDILREAADSRTRVLALSWVGYASGFRADVAKIVEFAHASGYLVLLDAIQGLGAFPLNVADCGVDFVAADGHKWLLGPEGAGLFYCREEHLDRLAPVGIGWNSLSQGAFDGLPPVLKDSAGRFEGGTMNVPGCLALGESLRVLLEAGVNQPGMPVSRAILNNVSRLLEQLSRAGFEVLVPDEDCHRSGIMGITWEAARQQPDLLNQARRHLLRQQIVTSVRAQRLRIATHAYNTECDIERLVTGLSEFRRQSHDYRG